LKKLLTHLLMLTRTDEWHSCEQSSRTASLFFISAGCWCWLCL